MSRTDESLELVVHKDWAERASDFFNPILVKETRQALKSRSFVSVFLLMLISSWLISAIGVLYVYGPELAYSAAGRNFFSAFYTVLSVAVFIVVPQSAFRSIQSERELQTFEMLTITTLSPRKVVWGKWWSATVQTIVYYAAIAPFMLFTNLLRGISLPFIVFVLCWSFLASVCLAMLAITFSTFTKQRQAFGVLQFLLVMPMISTLLSMLQMMYEVSGDELPFDELWFWFVQLVILSLIIPAFILCRQVATANLTFEGANRSTGIRISCLTLLTIALAWSLAFSQPHLLPVALRPGTSVAFELAMVWTTLGGLWLWLVGLFAVTEDDRLSRRVRQEVPRSQLVRWLVLPFFPGGGRGFIYFVFSVAMFAGTMFWVFQSTSGSSGRSEAAQLMLMAVVSYLLFYIGVTSFLGRLLRRVGPELHAAHARVLGILLAAVGIIGPFLFVFLDTRFADTAPILITTNAFLACHNLVYDLHAAPPVWAIFALGFLGLALNVPNMFESIREFMRPALPLPASTAPASPSTTYPT